MRLSVRACVRWGSRTSCGHSWEICSLSHVARGRSKGRNLGQEAMRFGTGVHPLREGGMQDERRQRTHTGHKSRSAVSSASSDAFLADSSGCSSSKQSANAEEVWWTCSVVSAIRKNFRAGFFNKRNRKRLVNNFSSCHKCNETQ